MSTQNRDERIVNPFRLDQRQRRVVTFIRSFMSRIEGQAFSPGESASLNQVDAAAALAQGAAFDPALGPPVPKTPAPPTRLRFRSTFHSLTGCTFNSGEAATLSGPDVDLALSRELATVDDGVETRAVDGPPHHKMLERIVARRKARAAQRELR